MLKLHIIVASTRPTRSADLVVPWVHSSATAHGGFDVELIDLRDWPLPIFAEHFETIGDITDPTYSVPIVKAWNERVQEADAYLVITPEYNHSIPAVLKNAVDNVWVSFGLRNKPVSVVGYSAGIGAGIRAIEHLAHVLIAAEAVPLAHIVAIPQVGVAFDDHGEPTNPITRLSLGVTLDDLFWWASALANARAAGELAPGVLRVQAAMASSQSSAA